MDWFTLESWKSAMQLFMDETCKRKEDERALLQKFSNAFRNPLRDALGIQQGGKARDLGLGFSNITAVFAWARDLKVSATENLMYVVPQRVMDSEVGVLRKLRACLTGFDSVSAVELHRHKCGDGGSSEAFDRAWTTFKSAMSQFKLQIEERLEALEDERCLAGGEERAAEDLADLIRTTEEVSPWLSTAGIEMEAIHKTCCSTLAAWKSEGVKQRDQTVVTYATSVHVSVKKFKENTHKWKQRYGGRWPGQDRQIGHLIRMSDDLVKLIEKHVGLDDLTCIVQLCEALQVLAEMDTVLRENPRMIKMRKQRDPGFWRKVYNTITFTPAQYEEWYVWESPPNSRYGEAQSAADTRYEEILATAARWLSSGSATVGFLGWEGHITQKQTCKKRDSMSSIHLSKMIWYEALVNSVHGFHKHSRLSLLEDALCGEIERVGAAVTNAKSALRFGSLRTSLVEARD